MNFSLKLEALVFSWKENLHVLCSGLHTEKQGKLHIRFRIMPLQKYRLANGTETLCSLLAIIVLVFKGFLHNITKMESDHSSVEWDICLLNIN